MRLSVILPNSLQPKPLQPWRPCGTLVDLLRNALKTRKVIFYHGFNGWRGLATGSGGLRDCGIARWWEADIGDFGEPIDVQVTLGAAK